jgi:ComF family protein
LDLVFPPKCLVCGAYGSVDVCDGCRNRFAPIALPVCERCGVSTEGTAALCPGCEDGPGWSFAWARAAGHFSGPLRDAILRLKYGDKRRIAAPLGQVLGQFLSANPISAEPPDLIVPVPLHRSRQRERGFNQSAILAREVGAILGIPVAENLVIRQRRTRPQAELHASERATNVRDAFAAEESPVLRRASVLLIDDVLTTMHTVDECARVLTDAGAASVYVAAVARGS